MNDDILLTYEAADEVLRQMLMASGHATMAHELTTIATLSDDPQDVDRVVSETRARLNQRLAELKSLDSDIRTVTQRLEDYWQRLEKVRSFSYADTGPYAVGEMLVGIIPAVRRWISETRGWLLLGDVVPVGMPIESQRLCNRIAESFPVQAMQGLRDRLLREKSFLQKNAAAATRDPDPFSIGRMKRRWLAENPDLLDRQFEAIRTKNRDRVHDAGGGGRGPWQFRRSLCHEFGLNCPEFSESSL